MKRTAGVCVAAVWALVVFALIDVGSARGQATTSLRGTITDPSGAAIPKATVHLINSDTNLERTDNSDSQGTYTFVQVIPGTYRLAVEAPGFSKYEQTGIQLFVNLPATINVRLKIGRTEVTVQVSEQAPLLNTTDASEGNTMGTLQLEQLPIEARDVVQLLSLQPGVVYTSDRPDFAEDTNDTRSGAVNGERSDQSNVALDGIDDNQQNTGQAFQSVLPVPIESVQEFRVTTSNYGADEGRSSGAQVALVTKGGTNNFHGALYEFNRSGIGEANDFFIKSAEAESGKANVPPHLVRNVFGADLGGPVKKDRLFFFLNYEGHRLSQADSEVREVPTGSLRDGVIMYLCDTTVPEPSCTARTVAGLSGKSYNVPAGYYALGPSQIKAMDPLGIGPSATVLKYFDSYPLPNDTTVGDNYNFSGFRFAAPSSERDDWLVGRIDYKLTSSGNHTLFWRGSGANDNNPQAPFLPGDVPEMTVIDRSKGFVVGYTAILKSDLVNNFRFGLTRQSINNIGDTDQPWNYIRNLDQGIQYGNDYVLPVYNIVDDLAWTKGNHSITFGTDIRFLRNATGSQLSSFSYGTLNSDWLNTGGFAGTPSPFNPACNSQFSASQCGTTIDTFPGVDSSFSNAYDFPLIGMLGMVSEVNAQYNYIVNPDHTGTELAQGAPVKRHWDSDEYDFYMQDSWKLRSNLTVNYGLRYELMSPVWEANGQQAAPTIPLGAWFNQRAEDMLKGIPSNASPNISYNLAGPKYGTSGYYGWQTKNFAPRVSFAWSPQPNNGFLQKLVGGVGHSVVRAVFGMYYDHFGEELVQTFDQNGGAFGLSSNLGNAAGIETASSSARLTGMNTIPTTDKLGNTIFIPAPPAKFPELFPLDNFCICFGLDSALKTPYSYAIDLSYQRQITPNLSIEVSYVGHMGHRLLAQDDLAMPMDIVDPKTKVDYFSAAKALAKLYSQNSPPPSLSVTPSMVGPTASYWKDMMLQPLQPGGAYSLLCSGGSTTSALQAVYDLYSCFTGNETTALAQIDQTGIPDANLSNVSYFPFGGPYSYFDNQYSSLYAWRTMTNSSYNAMQVVLKREMSHGLQFDFNYTYSHSLDIASDAERVNWNSGLGPGGIVNAWDPRQLYGPSDFDLRHQFNANWIWQLPVGRGQAFANNVGKGMDALIGGWQLSGLARWSSGFPVSVDNGSFFPTDWELEGEGALTGSLIPTGKAVVDGNVNMFTNPANAYAGFRHDYPGESGARNPIRGDGYAGLDMGLAKTWKMPYNEQHTLEFEWNVFNVPNLTRFNVENASLTLDAANTFGRYTHLLTNPRIMQFGLRYAF